WESCLPVIDQSMVIIIIIDGRYGTPLSWPNFKSVIGNRKVSPTHGEFIYSRATGKRILVFIRSGLIQQYDAYRTAKNKCRSSSKVRQAMSEYMPKYLD